MANGGGADDGAGAIGSVGPAQQGNGTTFLSPAAQSFMSTPTAESPPAHSQVTPRSLLGGHAHDRPLQAFNGHGSGGSASSSPGHAMAAQHAGGLPAIGLLPTRTPTPVADSSSACDSTSPQLNVPHQANIRRASQPAFFDPSALCACPVSPNSGREVLASGSPFSKSTSAPPTILRRLSSSASSPGPGSLSPARSFVTISNTMIVRNTGRRLPELPDAHA